MTDPQDLWSAIDAYVEERLLAPDAARDDALCANAAADLPTIDVSPAQAKFLALIIRICGARRVLEVGTLGGYSTICLAQTLPPDGSLVSLEINPRFAEVARGNIAVAGLGARVEIRVGPAQTSLDALVAAGEVFDFVFIDADKPNNARYVESALALSRPGTIIIVDNVVRDGALIDPESTDPSTIGSRALMDMAHADPRLEATVLQTVGLKGHDGMFISVVTSA